MRSEGVQTLAMLMALDAGDENAARCANSLGLSSLHHTVCPECTDAPAD